MLTGRKEDAAVETKKSSATAVEATTEAGRVRSSGSSQGLPQTEASEKRSDKSASSYQQVPEANHRRGGGPLSCEKLAACVRAALSD